MNVALLIDSIVRQTTVLIAQLATTGGVRTPLVDVADQVFRELAEELHRQGVSRKVAADMFGMALRTYRRKIQRFTESQSEQGRSLWEALHRYVTERGNVTRGELLQRFPRDDELTVKAVLQDLVDSGFLFRSGRGASAVYRAVSREEMDSLAASQSHTEAMDVLVWGALYRAGGGDRSTLTRDVNLPEAAVDEALERLTLSGRIRLVRRGSTTRYEADEFVVPLGAPVGWEAAVFDHFQAVVNTVTSRLRSDDATSSSEARVGGSTYTLEIWPGHPLEEEALGELALFRARLTGLRARVAEFNASAVMPRKRRRVVVYGGQHLLDYEEYEGSHEE